MTACNGPGADMLIYNIHTTCSDLTMASTGCGKVQYIPEYGAEQRQRRMISLGIQDKQEKSFEAIIITEGQKCLRFSDDLTRISI